MNKKKQVFVVDPKEDVRNLIDRYKGLSNERVKNILSIKRVELEVAIENIDHDFNVGTIVRSANNFNVQCVHIIGRKKYNRRGAMCTDKYIEIKYWQDTERFIEDQRNRGREIVAIENNIKRARPINDKKFIQATTLIFGSEGNGISERLVDESDDVRYIESFGSTRSLNVGVAAGVAMYEWVRQNVLSN